MNPSQPAKGTFDMRTDWTMEELVWESSMILKRLSGRYVDSSLIALEINDKKPYPEFHVELRPPMIEPMKWEWFMGQESMKLLQGPHVENPLSYVIASHLWIAANVHYNHRILKWMRTLETEVQHTARIFRQMRDDSQRIPGTDAA